MPTALQRTLAPDGTDEDVMTDVVMCEEQETRRSGVERCLCRVRCRCRGVRVKKCHSIFRSDSS